jgi:uncharacterized protein YuzE
MQIHYDPHVDVLTIRLRNGQIAESDEVAPGMIVDFDAERVPLAIEILNAHRVLTHDGKLTLELPLHIAVSTTR